MSLSLDEGVNKCLLRDVRVDELFELVNGIKDMDRNTMKPGPYPLVSSSGVNNGFIDFVDSYNYDGTYISYARTGTVGSCFVQRGKFMLLNHSNGLLKLKDEYKYLDEALVVLAFTMTLHFRGLYKYSTLLSNDRLMNEVIPDIPFVRDANGEWVIDVSGLRYMYI